MALTTSTITGRVPLPTDEVLQYAELTFALSGLDTQGADVLPGGIIKRVTLVNSELPAGFKLWRNTSGLRGTHYRVLARWSVKDRDGIRDQYADLGIIQVGSSPSYTLASLINSSVPAAIGTFWISITQAQYDAAIAARDAAIVAQEAAELAADQAALYDGPKVDTFPEIASVTAAMVDVGGLLRCVSLGAVYVRASDAATDADLDYTGGGGVKWHFVTTEAGRFGLSAFSGTSDLSSFTGTGGSEVKIGGQVFAIYAQKPFNANVPNVETASGLWASPKGLELSEARVVMVQVATVATGVGGSGTRILQGAEIDYEGENIFLFFSDSYDPGYLNEVCSIQERPINLTTGAIGALTKEVTGLSIAHGDNASLLRNADGTRTIITTQATTTASFGNRRVVKIEWDSGASPAPVELFNPGTFALIGWYDANHLFYADHASPCILAVSDVLAGTFTPVRYLPEEPPLMGGTTQQIKHIGGDSLTLGGGWVSKKGDTWVTSARDGRARDILAVHRTGGGVQAIEAEAVFALWSDDENAFIPFVLATDLSSRDTIIYRYDRPTSRSKNRGAMVPLPLVTGEIARGGGKEVVAVPKSLWVAGNAIYIGGRRQDSDVMDALELTVSHDGYDDGSTVKQYATLFAFADEATASNTYFFGAADENYGSALAHYSDKWFWAGEYGMAYGPRPTSANVSYGFNLQTSHHVGFYSTNTAAFCATGAVLDYSVPTGQTMQFGSVDPVTGAATNWIDASVSYFRPRSDNTLSLGGTGARWTQVWAATGTINTSDANEKTAPQPIDENLLDAWGDVSVIAFQWLDAVAEKGADARWHVGVIAQQVRDALAAHGVDGTRYGLLCHDVWADEYEPVKVWREPVDENDQGEWVDTGDQRIIREAGELWGIRADQCLWVETAYQRRRSERIEARLAKIEKMLM